MPLNGRDSTLEKALGRIRSYPAGLQVLSREAGKFFKSKKEGFTPFA